MELLGWFFLVTIGIVAVWFGCKVGDPPRHWSLYFRERWYQVPVGWFLVGGGIAAIGLNGSVIASSLWRMWS